MNNNSIFLTFDFFQCLQIHVHVDIKMFFLQCIALTFGPERLRDILDSPKPVMILFINYEVSFEISDGFFLWWVFSMHSDWDSLISSDKDSDDDSDGCPGMGVATTVVDEMTIIFH